MTDNNYAEYTVAQKAEGKYKTRKLLLILLYAAFGITYFTLLISKIPMLIALLPVFIWMLVFFTWKYAKVDHKYEVVSAHITFTEIYGGKKESVIFDHLVSELSIVAPLNDEYRAQSENADVYIDCRGTKKSPDSYFLVYENEGKKTVVFFEATNKAIKVMTFYNKKNVISVDYLKV